MILYRPIGLFEYRLLESNNFTEFPKRLSWQPIFYPVLTLKYAEKIALEWNTNDRASGFIGYVTKFQVSDDYIKKFEIRIVGDASCQELWVPSEDLPEFNSHIQGKIEIINIFKGKNFEENAEMPEILK